MGPFCVSVSSWLKSGEDFLDLLGFVEGAEAAGADLNFDCLAVAHQRLLVDIGKEPGLGVTVGVADIVAAHPGL